MSNPRELVAQAIELLTMAGVDYHCLNNETKLLLSPQTYSHHHLRGLYADGNEDLAPIQESLDAVAEMAPFQWVSLLLSILCLLCASCCAGLILGILSLDTLMLHIKIRAGSDPDEQRYAEQLLPLVQKRHLVLVSLLLLNFLADETLPLFMDNLFPTWLAVVASVVLVVFVSEIIPSALFIGPDQLRLAAMVSPFAYFVIIITYPLSYPISKLLDYLLDDEDERGNQFNRGELSALVRIQYEGRLAAKRRELKERRAEMGIVAPFDDDQSDFSDLLPSSIQIPSDESIHTREVNMLEGALALKSTRKL